MPYTVKYNKTIETLFKKPVLVELLSLRKYWHTATNKSYTKYIQLKQLQDKEKLTLDKNHKGL